MEIDINRDLAYERATKYAQTKETFSEAAHSGFLGTAAGAAIGVAIGILSGENVAKTKGKGAAVGAVGGAVVGGANATNASDARHAIVEDLQQKSLQTRSIAPNSLAYGFVFFPAEAKTAKTLRLQHGQVLSALLQPVGGSFLIRGRPSEIFWGGAHTDTTLDDRYVSSRKPLKKSSAAFSLNVGPAAMDGLVFSKNP